MLIFQDLYVVRKRRHEGFGQYLPLYQGLPSVTRSEGEDHMHGEGQDAKQYLPRANACKNSYPPPMNISTAYIAASTNRFSGASDVTPEGTVIFGSSNLIGIWDIVRTPLCWSSS